jgi:alpha-amylase
VYGWEQGGGRLYDFGDRKADFFAAGYDALINFGFKHQGRGDLDSLFTSYAMSLQDGALKGVAILNYASSHDDGGPLDLDRRDPLRTGTALLLAPGGAQIYYGDELARPLKVPGAEGDANLRGMMNWGDLSKPGTLAVLDHWRRLGTFRRNHPAVGAGVHRRLQAQPYIFSRTLGDDRVVVALDQPGGAKTISVFDVFPEGTEVVDEYSGVKGRVVGGKVSLTTPAGLVLLSSREGPNR